jgi:asparagine synthase (glutamine-hydrolysing)
MDVQYDRKDFCVKRFAGWLDAFPAVKLSADPAPEVYDQYRVFYRGYIANVRALVEESEKRGEMLKEGSDGELFVKAYEWWGEKLQSYVLGEYAVAIFDQQRLTFLLTHDALGRLPLFYSQKSESFVFGSHLEDLIRHTGIGELDEEYIANYLATGMVIGARTPYRSLRRLLPGQSLHWINGQLRLRKTWDITCIQPVILRSDEEYEERLRFLLHEGVTTALRSEGKVWSELSGGLDSSSIVCMAAHSGNRLEALSVIYSSSKSADEREWMKAVVGQYALPWHTLDGDEVRPFAELPEGFCAEPINVLPSAGLLRRYKALAQFNGVRVILSGFGGDQVFGGDSPKPYYLADLVPLQLGQLGKALRDWQARDEEGRSVTYHFLKNVLRPSLSYWTRRSLAGPEATSPPFWLHLGYVRALRLKRRSRHQVAPRCRSVGQQYFAENIWKTALSAADEQGQIFEWRNPLLYRPLVEFMFAIPWEQRIRPAQDRYLQRRALKGVLPEHIRERHNKVGTAEAAAEGLRNGSPWTELLLARPRVVEKGYVDARAWREVVNQVRFGRMVSMRHFSATATLEVWLRQLEDVRLTPGQYSPASLTGQ